VAIQTAAHADTLRGASPPTLLTGLI